MRYCYLPPFSPINTSYSTTILVIGRNVFFYNGSRTDWCPTIAHNLRSFLSRESKTKSKLHRNDNTYIAKARGAARRNVIKDDAMVNKQNITTTTACTTVPSRCCCCADDDCVCVCVVLIELSHKKALR